MNRLFPKMLAGGVLCVALVGCAGSPYNALQSPDMPSQISMQDWYTQQAIRVTKAVPERVGAGQLKVTVEVYNSTNSDVSLDYRYSFVDHGGVAVENQTGWQLVKVPARGVQAFAFTSTSPVDDFSV